MAIKQVIASTVFTNGCETHYAFRSHIDPADYPQVHDFYEIILIVAGKLKVLVNNECLELSRGNLLLIRPGDTHTKKEYGPCQHINLAFPASTVEALFNYLYDSPKEMEYISAFPHVPICTLSDMDSILMQNRLTYLNLLPAGSVRRKNTYLRTILTDILSSYFINEIYKSQNAPQDLNIPTWLAQAIEGLSDIRNLEAGMDYLVSSTNRTPEHICRSFRKYLNMSPMSFINAKRLNYAANLLKHSDKEILDIAYESGFQSVSHFYHLFKKEYQLSPLKFKNQNCIPHNF